MLSQYRDCFSEVSRQTRWYRDLREAYQDLRCHAENIKREALLAVDSSQKEVDTLKRQCHSQGLLICQLKEQVWEAEQARQRAEGETDDVQERLSSYSQQICQFKSRLESVQSQLKETQARMEINEEQEELRQLRKFKDKWERAARSLDIDNQDKDCWTSLKWCESSESEDSQKREAKLEATLGLLLVEAGKRRRADVKDCDSTSTPCTDLPTCDSQGQLQGVLEENQQLRDQLGQLRDHNASLTSQLQEQFEDSARCLADISSSLDDDIEIMDPKSLPRGVPKGSTGPTGGPAIAGVAGTQGRVSRASSSGSCGSSSSGRGGHPGRRHHHHHHRNHLHHPSPEGAVAVPVPAVPWDYADHTDLCDSGFWSLQASPPRSTSVLAPPSPAPTACTLSPPRGPHGPHPARPARLCWLGSSPVRGLDGGLETPRSQPHLTPSGAAAFILNARRPRSSRR